MQSYHSVKYQALLLVVVIIVSVYAMRFFPFLGDAAPSAQSSSMAQILSKATNDAAISQDLNQHQGDGTPRVSPRVIQPRVSEDSIAGNPSLPNDKVATCAGVGAGLYRAQDLTTGRVLFANDQGQRWPIASITKLITAVVAMNFLKQDSVVAITPEIEAAVGNDHTLAVGQSYSVRDLINIMLVVSSNDAAYALADAYGLSGFVNQMNETAKTVGMDQTIFYEPSGLSYLNQSTLENIAKLLGYLYRAHPDILAVTRQQKFVAYDQAGAKRKTFSNIDFYAGQSVFVGGKTGYISQSGENLVGIFTYGGGKIIAEVLNSADRFKDMDALVRCANTAWTTAASSSQP